MVLTPVQKMIVQEFIDNGRQSTIAGYVKKSVDALIRGGFIIETDDGSYRATPKAAEAMGKFTLAEKWRMADAAANDPNVALARELEAEARALGVSALHINSGSDRLSVTAVDLKMLLDLYRAVR
jgi:hypothetical protein